MSETHGLLIVTSEDQALVLLETALKGTSASDLPTLVNFQGWPTLNVHLPHTPVDGSISPTMMEAFIELQTSLYPGKFSFII